MQFSLQRGYLLFTIILFLTEVFIALFIHDKFIRPYVGDFLVVIFIYCFIKSFTTVSPLAACICVLLFSYLVETLQHFNLVNQLGLQHSKLATIIIGNSFAWEDIIAYTAGIILVLFIEHYRLAVKQKNYC